MKQNYNQKIKKIKKLDYELEYDIFLHTIQQPKMKELWDNSQDEF